METSLGGAASKKNKDYAEWSNRLGCVLNNVWEEEVEGRRGMLFKTNTAYTSPTYCSTLIGKAQRHFR